MPIPGNVRQLPIPGTRWYVSQPPVHGLSVFATLTARCVAVVLIALFAFTLGLTARQGLDLPRMGLMQTAILETEQVCRDIAHGVWVQRKGN